MLRINFYRFSRGLIRRPMVYFLALCLIILLSLTLFSALATNAAPLPPTPTPLPCIPGVTAITC